MEFGERVNPPTTNKGEFVTLTTGKADPSVDTLVRPRSPNKRPQPIRRSPNRSNKVLGRLVCHRDGYGFVIPDEPLPNVQGDIFIGAEGMGSAIHGDRVQVSDLRIRRNGRAEGRIQKVLERAHETIVGEFHYGTPFNYVVPYEQRIPHRIVIPKGKELPSETPGNAKVPHPPGRSLEGMIVNLEILRFPTATQDAMGKVLEVLGQPSDFGVDVEIIIRKHHLPFEFPPDVLWESQQVPPIVPAEAIRGRRDFRHLPIVTIDGETARDFDDAVAVVPLPNGHFQLQVHIADVAAYVHSETPLDREARLRGTSVYFPDRAIPMLPPELSSGICSLKPKEDRLVLSVLMEIDRQGEILDAEFCEGVIRSAERMTYTGVNAVLENDPRMRSRYAVLAPHFEQMRDLALALNKKRRRLGAIDFDLPEPVIEFDEFGVMIGIVPSERNIAHRIIEEFMLAANEAVASYLDQLGIATLYRIHEKPDPAKVVEFEEIAAAFGYSLGVGPLPMKRFSLGRERRGRQRPMVELPAGDLKVTPRHYQQLTDRIAGKPEERILSYLMLRSLQQARYAEQNEGHFALATPCYTHFTSPIRRYPDLIVHRILRAVLTSTTDWAGKNGYTLRAARQWVARHRALPPDPISPTELKEIALESSEAERRADDAERELVEWKKTRFMRDKLGEEFDALIISVTKSGFFVELTDLFVEGLVLMETLTDQRYVYREQERQWVGERTRRRFQIGDRLRVRLDRVGRPGEKMHFSVVANKHL
ncbi:MAG: VacB/RNase II family 3'-5' exoribonuclease [Acidobacteria bacterium]|nr:VacB/RNase II family 3'-5' exoribonuclease [Acidobacteriota bacterium]